MPESGPYLTLAALCERALQEADGTLSLIRLIDRVQINLAATTAPGVAMPTIPAAPAIPLTFAVALKSGDFSGSQMLLVRIETPSGFKVPDYRQKVTFEGEDRGATIVIPMQFPAQDEGVYWFVVELGDVVMTRVPLRIIKQTTQQTVPPQL